MKKTVCECATRFGVSSRLVSVVVMASLGLMLGGCITSGPGYRNLTLKSVQAQQTPDGQTVLTVVDESFISFEEVIERSPNVSAVARVTNFEGERNPSRLTVSPDGDSVVFAATETDGRIGTRSNLWRVGTRGTGGISRITAGNYYDTDPAFGADGTRIYFASNRNSSVRNIWHVSTSGAGGISMLTRSDADDGWPVVCSETGKVFYQSRPERVFTTQIWSVADDGGLPTQLAEGFQPDLTPDGETVVFTHIDEKSRRTKLWTMGADALNPTQLTSGVDSNERHASWSPGGRQIVFASNMAKDSNGKKNYDIWMMDLDGGDLRQLTTNGSTDLYPRFSPDGRTVYFLSNRGFQWNIWRMDVSRGGPGA